MSLIIFDFDGTIGDSFAYVYQFMAKEAGRRRNTTEPDEVQYRQLSMKSMALKMGIPLWRLPFLYFRGRRAMREHIVNIKPFDGMPEVIRTLHQSGHTLTIISSNSSSNVKQFLKRHDLGREFAAIRGNAGFLGKVSPIKKYCKRFKAKHCWYIGDEVTDVVSAKAAGVDSLAVTWGFASRDQLQSFQPTALADKAADIVPIIQAPVT